MTALNTLLRAPLVQFLAIGALLAVAWTYIPGDSAGRVLDGEDVIRVDAGRLAQIRGRYERAFQREPTAEELAGLVRAWVREEALYRAARELQLDQDDAIVRRRLAQKLEFLVEPAPGEIELTEAELEDFLQSNPELFREPMQIALEQIHLPAERANDAAIEDVRRALAAGNTEALPPPTGILPPSIERAPISSVARRFGQDFATRVAETPIDEWTGPVPSPFGVHFVRVTERMPARLPPLEAIRGRVEALAESARRRELLEQRTQDIIDRFDVVIEGDVDLDAASDAGAVNGTGRG